MDRRRAGRRRTTSCATHLAPVVEQAAAAGRVDRHRAAQPLRDLAGQHRRPGADRAGRRCSARPSAWRWTPTTSTSRSAPAPTPSGAPASTWCTSRSAAATGARPAATRPTGRRCSPRSTRSATPARWTSRASPPTTPPSPRPPRSGGRWPPTQDDLARDGLALPAVAHRLIRPRPGRPAWPSAAARVSPSSATPSWARPTPTRGATSAPSTPTCPPVRQQVLVGRDADGGRGGRGQLRLGRVGHRLARRSSSATTSTSSTSASPGTCTPRSPSRRSRPASTCWSRSRWPTRSPRPRTMVAAAGRRRERGVLSMVGFNYRRVPALALARDLIAAGRLGDVRQVRGGLPPGLAGRRRRPDDVAAAQARPPARARSATSARTSSTRCGSCSARTGRRRQRRTCTRSSRQRTGADGPEDGHRRRRRLGARCGTVGGAVASVEVTRMATGRKNALTIEVYGTGGVAAPSTSSGSTSCRCCDSTAPAGFTPGAGHRGRRTPTSAAWWPPGPRPRLGPHVHHPGRRLPRRDRRRHGAVAVVRGRARRAAGAGGDRGRVRHASGARVDVPLGRAGGRLMGKRVHPLHRPVGRPDPRGGRRAGGRLGLRRPGDRGLRRAPRRLALGRRRLRRGAARRSCDRHGLGLLGDLQPPHRPGGLRRPDRRPAPGDRARPRVWGDGDPEGVRQRAAEEMQLTARLAQADGRGRRSSASPGPRSGSTSRCSRRCPPSGSRPATRTSPTAGTRSSTCSTSAACGSRTRCTPPRSPTTTGRRVRTLEAIGHREAFGINWDPSHMMWQDLDPVAFITDFADRIYHVDCKDTRMRLGGGRNGSLSSHLPWGDPRRGWDFVSTGRGDVPWEDCFRALRRDRLRRPDLGRVGGRRHGPPARRPRGAGVPAGGSTSSRRRASFDAAFSSPAAG